MISSRGLVAKHTPMTRQSTSASAMSTFVGFLSSTRFTRSLTPTSPKASGQTEIAPRGTLFDSSTLA